MLIKLSCDWFLSGCFQKRKCAEFQLDICCRRLIDPSAPVAVMPNVAVAMPLPTAPGPDGIRMRGITVMTAYPNPTTAHTNAPITWHPDVSRARRHWNCFHLRRRRCLVNDGAICRRDGLNLLLRLLRRIGVRCGLVSIWLWLHASRKDSDNATGC